MLRISEENISSCFNILSRSMKTVLIQWKYFTLVKHFYFQCRQHKYSKKCQSSFASCILCGLWLMHQSILDWVSVDTRSSIGWYISRVSTDVSTNTPIGQYTWWFTETSPIHVHYLHQVYWLISVNISVDTLVDTGPTLDRTINALVSVDNVGR